MTSLPLSPFVPDSSDDLVTAIMGSSREESITPSEVIVIGSPVGDVLPVPTDAEILADSPLSTAEGLLADLLWAPVALRPQGISGHGDQRSSDRIPRWRRMCLLQYLISGLGLRFAVGRIRDSLESSALLRMDWRSGVGQSAGDGTWKVP